MPETRVLVVEDNFDVAEMLAMVLEGWGCRVRIAHTGVQAIQEATEEVVDLIVCDLNLPDVPGVELLPRLLDLDTCQDTVAVSLSGQAGPKVAEISKDAGFQKHLVKPASFQELRDVLALSG